MKIKALIHKLKKLSSSPVLLEYVGRSFQMVSSGGFVALLFQKASEQFFFLFASLLLASFGLMFFHLAERIKNGDNS